MLEERRLTEESIHAPTSSGMSSIPSVFREQIQATIIDGKDIEVSFDDFPYYLRYASRPHSIVQLPFTFCL